MRNNYDLWKEEKELHQGMKIMCCVIGFAMLALLVLGVLALLGITEIGSEVERHPIFAIVVSIIGMGGAFWMVLEINKIIKERREKYLKDDTAIDK